MTAGRTGTLGCPDFYGLSGRKIAAALAPALTLADLFVEMEQALRVVGESDGPDRLKACWDQYINDQS